MYTTGIVNLRPPKQWNVVVRLDSQQLTINTKKPYREASWVIKHQASRYYATIGQRNLC